MIEDRNLKAIKFLGRDGFGEVYLMSWYHDGLSEEVAIKRPCRNFRSEAVSNIEAAIFLDEADLLKSFKHQNIVEFRGLGAPTADFPNGFIIMEYMSGGSLRQYLTMARFSQRKLWEVAIDITRGLEYLHNRGVLHRDINSYNILLDSNLQAKISDFGLSMLSFATPTTAKRKGAMAWMAPEIFIDISSCSKNSDIYSLGVVLSELVSGDIPFKNTIGDVIPFLVSIGQRDEIPATCHPDLRTIIEQCWNMEKTERPSATKVLEALEKIYGTMSQPEVSTNDCPARDRIEPETTFKMIDVKDIEFGNRLGSGSFGAVYSANWRGGMVAVKVYNHHWKRELTRESLPEHKLQALGHPNMIKIYGYSTNHLEGCFLSVLEYMAGGSLWELLHTAAFEDISWMRKCQIALDMTLGLKHLHEHNILHLNIKSSVVFLDHRGRAKLNISDSLVQDPYTLQYSSDDDRAPMGSIPWMAPELFSYSPSYSKKANVYSLGITFWELVTGKMPFEAVAGIPAVVPYHIMQGHRDMIPSECPPTFASLITRCWHSEPDNRPSVEFVLEELVGLFMQAATEDGEARSLLMGFTSDLIEDINHSLRILKSPLASTEIRLQESIKLGVESCGLLLRLHAVQEASEPHTSLCVTMLEIIQFLFNAYTYIDWSQLFSGMFSSCIVEFIIVNKSDPRVARMGCDVLRFVLSHISAVESTFPVPERRYCELLTDLIRIHIHRTDVMLSVLAVLISLGSCERYNEALKPAGGHQLLTQMLIIQLLQQRQN